LGLEQLNPATINNSEGPRMIGQTERHRGLSREAFSLD
jgi:hypothetical protein